MTDRGFFRALNAVFQGHGFPVFTIALIASYELSMLALLLVPTGSGELAAFADEFRMWCFGYDPATGGFEVAFLVSAFTSPLLLVTVIVAVWWRPLREVLARRPRAVLPWVALAAASTGLSGVLLFSMGTRAEEGELPFPAESLRTELTAPDFALENQDGQKIALADLRGRVVLVTAVYATCGYTCPMIMGQAKAVLAGLSDAERGDLTVVGITLDPEHDTIEVLATMARAQGVEAPLFNLVTGEPAEVERVLDAFGVARARDPATGIIDHANLFLLIDRQGLIAYRLSLGERQAAWLRSALRLLLGEAVD